MPIKPFYCDLHIHTYKDANKKDDNYDVETLASKIGEAARGNEALISFTDHNTINKNAYSKMCSLPCSTIHLVVGVELTVGSDGKKPYHAHVFFEFDSSSEQKIDEINELLDDLYPNKLPSKEDDIPKLPDILNALRNETFLLLPHGGQSHSTFDNSLQEGDLFDDMMLRSIYYNAFDGYTARSSAGLEKTKKYFATIGIDEFTNLLTGSDNYDPKVYPNPKDDNAEPYTPTWVYAEPTFNGLRLALSEKDRLSYCVLPPENYLISEPSISHVELHAENIDIDVDLSVGLNVIIGSSSSGKTLFAEALARKTSVLPESDQHDFYNKFEIDNVEVTRSDNSASYYINQSYISKVVGKEVNHETIDSIEILRDVFPGDAIAEREMDEQFSAVRNLVKQLCSSAEKAQKAESALSKLRNPQYLIVDRNIGENAASLIKPDGSDVGSMSWNSAADVQLERALDDIEQAFESNPLLYSISKETAALRNVVSKGKQLINLHEKILSIIEDYEEKLGLLAESIRDADLQKTSDFESVLNESANLITALIEFAKAKQRLRDTSFKTVSKELKLQGHSLSMVYSFDISDDLLLKTINSLLKVDERFERFDDITAESFTLDKLNGNLKIKTFGKLSDKLISLLDDSKRCDPAITTKNGVSWNELSEGRKTAVLLDIILAYSGNTAPLIIDQPEDNLASDYINDGLSAALKGGKGIRQTIIVTHNATIPMLADAQTIVLCRQIKGKLLIKSAPLEGELDGKRVLDWIAEITDGGKPSIQKRIKKYDFRKF